MCRERRILSTYGWGLSDVMTLGRVWGRRLLAMAIDAAIVVVVFYFALQLRFEWSAPLEYGLRGTFPVFVAVAVCVVLACNWIAGVYTIVTRYIGLVQALKVVEAAVAATLALAAFVVLWPGEEHLTPVSVVLVGGLEAMVVMVGVRFYSRIFQERSLSNVEPDVGLLLVGAGNRADLIIRDVQSSPQLRMRVAGIVDDDPSLRGMRVNGVPVVGRIEDIPWVTEQRDVSEILITLDSPTAAELSRVHEAARATQLPIKTLPGLAELVDAPVSVHDARELRIEDLLGRPKVEIDLGAVASYLEGKRVLITGAAGSIGSELCRQIAGFGPAELVLVDKDESALYYLHEDLRKRGAAHYTINPTSVALPRKMDSLFATWRPHVVFHAAAFKHVPLMELHPDEAVINNVRGTLVVGDAAGRYRAERVVNISTDKAVEPVNVMGATKRLGEQIMHQLAERYPNTRYSSVRFGNVLGSRGSVIPVFTHQIESGGPVTITHPEMTRYFMTIEEAVQLVLQAAALVEEVPASEQSGYGAFVLEMGEPVPIVDLAQQMIGILATPKGAEVAIEYTGLRPGEKLHEELFFADETPLPTSHSLIRLAHVDPEGVAGSRLAPRNLGESLVVLLAAAERGTDPGEIIEALQACVPTYSPFDWDRVGEFPGIAQALGPAVPSGLRASLIDQALGETGGPELGPAAPAVSH